jgi:hypothetical protein
MKHYCLHLRFAQFCMVLGWFVNSSGKVAPTVSANGYATRWAAQWVDSHVKSSSIAVGVHCKGILRRFCPSGGCFRGCREPNVWNCCYAQTRLLHKKCRPWHEGLCQTTPPRDVTPFQLASHIAPKTTPFFTFGQLSGIHTPIFLTPQTVPVCVLRICPSINHRNFRVEVAHPLVSGPLGLVHRLH